MTYRILLNAEQWEAFTSMLDAEPRHCQALADLLKKQSIFDEPIDNSAEPL